MDGLAGFAGHMEVQYRSGIRMTRWAALCLLAALLSAPLGSAQSETKFALKGGNLNVKPPFVGNIVNILWKHGTDLVAEWAQIDPEVIYYGGFKDRTQLDTRTATLQITNINSSDVGLYTVEINNLVQKTTYDVVLINEVPQPTVWIRPVSCTAALEECALTCDGDVTGSEPVTYSWRQGDGVWKPSTKDMNITKSEVENVPTFSCRIQNPVSTKDSAPKVNPLFVKKEDEKPNTGAIVGGVIGGLLLVLGVGLGIWKRKLITSFFAQVSGGNNNDAQPDRTTSPKPNEGVPLKDGDTNGMDSPPV